MTNPVGPPGRDLPAYDDLPVIEQAGVSHSWGVFGADDEVGTLNLLTDETVVRALGEVRSGERIGLTLDLEAISPPLFGRSPLVHTLLNTDRNTWDDRIDGLFPQASSQWDGLRHVRAREFGFYGGVTDDPPAMGERLGVQRWASAGIIGRGVLLDIERFLAARGVDYDPFAATVINAETLDEVARFQGTELRDGDVLCLRFGWIARYRTLDDVARAAYSVQTPIQYAGLAAGEAMARALWDWHVAAVACDNPAAEVSPGDPAIGSLHRRLIPALGMAIGELLDFDELARCCAEREHWTFLFVAVPLNIRGGVGSPANAVAVL